MAKEGCFIPYLAGFRCSLVIIIEFLVSELQVESLVSRASK